MHSHSRRIPIEIETMSNKNAFRRSESIETEEHEFLESFIEANQFSFVYTHLCAFIKLASVSDLGFTSLISRKLR